MTTLEDTLRQIIREELAALPLHGSAPAERPERLHISSMELCIALGISRGTLKKMLAEGCPFVCPGKTPRFVLSDVEAFLTAKGDTRPPGVFTGVRYKGRAGNGGA